jgi:uncharacterized membrane protein
MPTVNRTSPRHNRRAGQSLIGAAVFATFLLALGAIGVDAVLVHAVQTRLSTAADAASMAGARALADGASSQEQTVQINRLAALLVKSNLPDGLLFSGPTGPLQTAIRVAAKKHSESDSATFEEDPSLDPGVREVRINVQTTVPTFFARLVGFPAVAVSASAAAERRHGEVALVPDRSAPQRNPYSWDNWQRAAAELLNRFDNASDTVSFAALGVKGSH